LPSLFIEFAIDTELPVIINLGNVISPFISIFKSENLFTFFLRPRENATQKQHKHTIIFHGIDLRMIDLGIEKPKV